MNGNLHFVSNTVSLRGCKEWHHAVGFIMKLSSAVWYSKGIGLIALCLRCDRLPCLVAKCALYSCWACQTCLSAKNGILTAAAHKATVTSSCCRQQKIGVLARSQVRCCETMAQFDVIFLLALLYYLFMHSCQMNTCIVAHSWHRMTLCYKFKQSGSPPPAGRQEL